MADDPDLQKRLDTFKEGKSKPRSGGIGVGALAIALAIGGAGVAYWLASSAQNGPAQLETSEVTPFQDGRPGGGRLEFPPDETDRRVNDALIAVEEALDVPATPAPEPNREVLDELAGQVRFSMAERDYTLAQLYERRSEYRAARLHYQLVIDEYSETTLADLSRERMAEIADLPDLPPQRMQWLVDLLPKPRDERPIFTSRAPR